LCCRATFCREISCQCNLMRAAVLSMAAHMFQITT
jgi:hypothetical protein